MLKSWVNPKWRVVIFLLLLNAAWIVAAWSWTDREHWLWIVPIALSINGLLLTYDQVLSFSRLHSQPMLGHDPWGVLKTVHRIAQKLKSREPEIFLIPHPAAQIFAYARSRRSTRLFITEGAINLLSPAEMEAVLTFQMLAKEHALTVLNYWTGAVIDLFYRAGLAFERAVAFVFGWSPKVSVWLVSPLLWVLRFFLLSPNDFQKLDRETANAIGSPEALARALWKMESYAQTKPLRESLVYSHMCIVSPLDWKSMLNLARVQPPMKRRIKDLLGRYPL